MARAAQSRKIDAYAVETILSRVASWDELKAELALLTETDKGVVFERLTQLYLQLSPVYQSRLRKVWLRTEVPPELVKKLHLPAIDQGIIYARLALDPVRAAMEQAQAQMHTAATVIDSAEDGD